MTETTIDEPADEMPQPQTLVTRWGPRPNKDKPKRRKAGKKNTDASGSSDDYSSAECDPYANPDLPLTNQTPLTASGPQCKGPSDRKPTRFRQAP